MKIVFEYPKEREEFEDFVAHNPDCEIWHDGPVMRVFTDWDRSSE